jgi:hypothetical protein
MREDRAVSTTLSYTLTLAISAILVSGLLLAGGSYVDSQRDQVVRDELTIVGQQLAAGMERADRLVEAGIDNSNLDVQVTQEFPDRVTGSGYRVEVDGSNSVITLESTESDISVDVGFTTSTDVADSSAEGGTIEIDYDESADALEVQDG